MAITGNESLLTSQLISAITTSIEVKFGGIIKNPEYIDALSEGIANAIIPFLVTNTQVNVGQSVNVPASGLESPDGAVTGSAIGTVDTLGTIS